ncbi:MAG: ADP-ribosylglycohydrolase family protein [Clostridia bacterium]|nr:ADP-ribosylglycohydrolase family protein [Clostridia bacterium]
MITRMDRVKGGFWGLLIGDALGVPYEFHSAAKIPPVEQVEFEPPKGFSRTYPGIKPGTWSDDGAQALCLLDSLLTCGKLDIYDFAKRLLAWYENGMWAVDNDVFDCGCQTGEALNAFRMGVSPRESGMVRPEGKGNGSLMRVLPLALWHRGSDSDLVRDAHAQSVITHGHPCNQVCCALYCLWARNLLYGIQHEDAFGKAVSVLRDVYRNNEFYLKELEWSLRPDDEAVGTGTGYVVDSIRSARMLLSNESYEQVVKSAVALGNDTDTTAAIVGGLAGIRDGMEAIPVRWLQSLRERDKAQGLLDMLLNVIE